MSEKKWYALRVYSGKEARVKAHIENEVELQSIAEKVGHIVIPSENIIEMKDGKNALRIKLFFRVT